MELNIETNNSKTQRGNYLEKHQKTNILDSNKQP